MRIGYFPIREGVNLSACLFPIRIVSSGLGLPVGVSQLCSPGSVVLCYRCPRRAGRPCAVRLVGVNVVRVPRVTSAVAPRPGIVEAWPISVRIPPGDHPPGVARRAAPPGAQQTAHRCGCDVKQQRVLTSKNSRHRSKCPLRTRHQSGWHQSGWHQSGWHKGARHQSGIG